MHCVQRGGAGAVPLWCSMGDMETLLRVIALVVVVVLAVWVVTLLLNAL